MVFDFGGGTLDVSIVKTRGKLDFDVTATAGEMQLSGEDIDSFLVHHFVHHFEEMYEKSYQAKRGRKNSQQVLDIKVEVRKRIVRKIESDRFTRDSDIKKAADQVSKELNLERNVSRA
ncbi:HSP70-8 [Ramazzottius varieornatus]|uniref:HSP70-8 n=1 Tax=Ramazzottius varieornatus TaxID=947166 RepID=A0A1D1VJD1_RAMVA|nr:HSP70-8 [Ramazzottius varieornatus]